MNRPLLLTVFLAGSLLARSAAAEIVVVNEDRRAAASALVSSPQDFDEEQYTEVAPDPGPFDVSLFADAVIADGSALATATQVSSITPLSMSAEGTVTGATEIANFNTIAYGFGQSNIAIRFTLTKETDFAIVGFLEAAEGGHASVQLSRPFQTVVYSSASNELLALDHSGTLEADTYDLNVTTSANGSAASPGTLGGSASYDVRFLLAGATDAPVVSAPALRAWPNPFRDNVHLALPAGTERVRILDASGRVVRTLAGNGQLLFDGRDAAGQSLSSGVYWVQPVGAPARDILKVVRLR